VLISGKRNELSRREERREGTQRRKTEILAPPGAGWAGFVVREGLRRIGGVGQRARTKHGEWWFHYWEETAEKRNCSFLVTEGEHPY